MRRSATASVSRTSFRIARCVYEWKAGRQRNFQFLFGAHAYSAGGVYSSAHDLARWIVALDTESILSGPSQADMWTAPRLSGGGSGSFGVGWVVGRYRGKKTVGHSGGPALADILRFPENRLTIIVLANQQRLYPWLAQGIADRLLNFDPGEAVAPFEDPEPETTRRLQALLAEASRGEADPKMFAPEAREGLVPAINDFMPLFFQGLEPVRSFVLVGRTVDDDSVTLVYRAVYGDKPLRMTFRLTAAGQVQDIDANPE